MLTTLAENRYFYKRSAATPLFGHFPRMARAKQPRSAKPHETTLQTLFVKRVREELDARGLKPNALSKRLGGPKQKTLDEVLNAGAVPRLTLVHQTAVALEMQPFELLRESDQIVKHVKVVTLRTYPSVFDSKDVRRSPRTSRRR